MRHLLILILFAVPFTQGFGQFSTSGYITPVIGGGQGNNQVQLHSSPSVVELPGGNQGVQKPCNGSNAGQNDLKSMRVNPGQEQITWTVFPNPAIDNCTLELATLKESAVQVIMYDMTGRKVFENLVQAGINGKIRKDINVSDYVNGVYLLSVVSFSDNGDKTESFSKLIQILH
jgi:hypothetical protein